MRVPTVNAGHQRGFTLIELMISIAIGMLLVIGAVTFYDAFVRAVRLQNAVAAQGDGGRYAIERLARDIRMAGYRDQAWLRPPVDNALVVTNGDPGPDVITVRYQADTDCVGNPTAAPTFLATNRFDVENEMLRCNGEVLAVGVENLQILLGEDTDNDGATNRIVAPGTAGLDPARVNSVRVYMLLVTPDNRLQRTPQTFTYFGSQNGDGTSRTYDDGRRRLELVAMPSLRNPIGT